LETPDRGTGNCSTNRVWNSANGRHPPPTRVNSVGFFSQLQQFPSCPLRRQATLSAAPSTFRTLPASYLGIHRAGIHAAPFSAFHSAVRDKNRSGTHPARAAADSSLDSEFLPQSLLPRTVSPKFRRTSPSQ